MTKQTKYTREFLEPMVQKSTSLRDLARNLGFTESAATLNLKPHIIRLNIDTSHFKTVKRKYRYTDEELFVENSPKRGGNSRFSSASLVSRLKRLKPYVCDVCGNTGEWQGKELGLDLHHINANNKDNRLENLVFLCPNCHSQTPSYKGKNRKETIINDTTKA